jgi:hypothetical protein
MSVSSNRVTRLPKLNRKVCACKQDFMLSVYCSCVMCLQPFYGGKLHRVTADVKSGRGELVCRVNGEWNGTLNFVDPSVSVSNSELHNKISVSSLAALTICCCSICNMSKPPLVANCM